MTIKKLMAAALIGLLAVGTTASADAAKGQKLYQKKLKDKCSHTQFEWEDINDEGKLMEEIQRQCPNVKSLKESYLPHLYDFFYEYASDSGNVPSC